MSSLALSLSRITIVALSCVALVVLAAIATLALGVPPSFAATTLCLERHSQLSTGQLESIAKRARARGDGSHLTRLNMVEDGPFGATRLVGGTVRTIVNGTNIHQEISTAAVADTWTIPYWFLLVAAALAAVGPWMILRVWLRGRGPAL